MIDAHSLEKLAQDLEIDEFTVLREYLQVQFLSRFYKNDLTRKIYFKGGTAIRFLLGSSRFSEDLDFTTELSTGIIKRAIDLAVEQLGGEFPELDVKEVGVVQGYSAKLYLGTELSRQKLTIKLDFSQREEVVEPMVSPIETVLPVGIVPLVEHLSAREILAEKIRAVLTRKKGRDLFDFWYLLSKKIPLDLGLVQKKLELYKKKFSMQELMITIQEWDEKDIDQDLRRFLPVSERRIIRELKRLILGKLSAGDDFETTTGSS